VCDGCALQLGVEAADDILADVFRVPVAKEFNPLNHISFVAIIRRVARALRAEAGPIEEVAAERAAELASGIDWPALSAAQREVKHAALQKQIFEEIAQAGEKELPGIKVVLETNGNKIALGTRKRLVKKYDLGIKSTMTERDTRTSATLVDHNCLFVRNQYGEVASRLSARARDIVAAGVEAGLGRDDIAGDLVKAMAGARRCSPTERATSPRCTRSTRRASRRSPSRRSSTRSRRKSVGFYTASSSPSPRRSSTSSGCRSPRTPRTLLG
jgi:hypothetical protein